MKTKLIIILIFTLLFASCDSLWNVNKHTTSISFDLDFTEILETQQSRVGETGRKIAEVSLRDSTTDSIIQQKKIEITDTTSNSITFNELEIGRTIYATILVKQEIPAELKGTVDPVYYSARSNSVILIPGENVLKTSPNRFFYDPLAEISGSGKTPDNPVNTLEEVIELSLNTHEKETIVYLMNGIVIEEDSSISLKNIILRRYSNFDAPLISLNGNSLELSNIILEGNKNIFINETKPLVDVVGELTVNSGTRIRYNNGIGIKISDNNGRGSIINLNSGNINGNTTGIFIEDSNKTKSQLRIQNNPIIENNKYYDVDTGEYVRNNISYTNEEYETPIIVVGPITGQYGRIGLSPSNTELGGTVARGTSIIYDEDEYLLSQEEVYKFFLDDNTIGVIKLDEPSNEIIIQPYGAISVFVEGGTFDFKGIDTTLDSFYMGKTEVTQAQWNAVMGDDEGIDNSLDAGQGNHHPMYWISWYDAIKFCNQLSIIEDLNPVYYTGEKYPTIPNIDKKTVLTSTPNADFSKNGYRLPTEAEWEYAAGGGNGERTIFSGTNDPNDLVNYAWFDRNSNNSNQQTAKKKPNQLGLYDMNGNVWEMCWDDSTRTPGEKVNKGGAYNRSNTDDLLITQVGDDLPTSTYKTLGFRVVKKAQ